jgi:hypothetical protein
MILSVRMRAPTAGRQSLESSHIECFSLAYPSTRGYISHMALTPKQLDVYALS